MTSAMIIHSNPYERHNHIVCVRADVLISAGTISLDLWRKWSQTIGTARRGGNGRPSLIALDRLPAKYRNLILETFGPPAPVAHPLLAHFSIDAAAREFYAEYRLADGGYLPAKHQVDYTTNASVLGATASLYKDRKAMRLRMGGSTSGVWASVVSDVQSFNVTLLQNFGVRHNLPKSERKLQEKLRDYTRQGYSALISDKFGNQNAQKVTDLMIKLWNDLFATQRHKPTYAEISSRYSEFLNGTITVVNSETGEIYDRKNTDAFRPISEGSVYNYLSEWENRVVTHKARSGDRQKYRQQYVPFHKLTDPGFSGSILSIDDRQPPFEYAQGKRLWFYNGIDLHSQAFICAVAGDTKEGIILEFYRQLVRNCVAFNIPIPTELECESSLNATFRNTLLQPGVLFQAARIEANNARGKRIEAFYRPLRYQYEKKREGWLARPFALSESNQTSPAQKTYIHKDQLLEECFADLEQWNNDLHPNQDKYPGMTRWEVCLSTQRPDAKPINWNAILPYLGHTTTATMKAGRILCAYQHRVVGHNGQPALGEALISILSRIEGKQVTIYWLDDSEGNYLKGVVYHNGRQICELLDDLSYNRSQFERTPDDDRRRQLTSAYVASVEGFINRGTRAIEHVSIIEEAPRHEPKIKFSFKPGTNPTTPLAPTAAGTDDDWMNPVIIPTPPSDDTPLDTDDTYINYSSSLKKRF